MSDRANNDAVEMLRKDASTNKPGLYRGKVEDIDDPDRLGRVKVRVWAIHGDEHRTPTTALSWAEIAEPGGGGYDYGTFDPPPVGSAVWVGFEGGLQDFPVVLGTFRGVPKRDSENSNVFLTNNGKPAVERAWLPPDDESETPKDIFEGVHDGDPHPTRRLWHKSYKGHTFIVEDGDGKEFLKIIDRAGQVIEMYCPVAVENSEGNKAQRGVRDAMRGDQLPHSAMRDRRASIRMRDLSGQEIVLDSRDQDERILIRGKNRQGGSENIFEIRSGRGRELIELRDARGDRITLNPNSSTPIQLVDSVGNAIDFDKEAGRVRIRSAKISEEETPQKRETVSGKKESEVRGDLEEKVHGNKKVTVVNDLTSGVLGNTSASFGGSLDVVIANQGLTGAPGEGVKINLAQLLGCDFELSNLNGDLNFNTKLGDILMDTLKGNVEFTTTLGNALLETLAGNVSAKTTAGKAELITSLGTANVDGTTVHLGPLAAAIQPIIRGSLGVAAVTAKNTAISATLPTLLSTSQTLLNTCIGPPPATIFVQVVGPFIAWLTALIAFVTAVQAALPAESAALLASLSTKSFTA